jgi:D-alanine transaminase
MSRIAYVNGRYVSMALASVNIEDRGYQFADGIYELIAIVGGKLVDEDAHLDRLDYSLGEMRIPDPMGRAAMRHVMRELIRRNRVKEGSLYIQVTRGVAKRDHSFPSNTIPSLVMTARRRKPLPPEYAEQGIKVVTVPDERWKRRDIKSINLTANILAKQAAREADAFEAWLVDDKDQVTEGSSTNAWIVTQEGELVTRHADYAILNGVTRQSVAELAKQAGLVWHQRPFTVKEAKAAKEAFLTSTTSYVLPVVRIDETKIGDGKPGPITLRLRELYVSALP